MKRDFEMKMQSNNDENEKMKSVFEMERKESVDTYETKMEEILSCHEKSSAEHEKRHERKTSWKRLRDKMQEIETVQEESRS